MKVDEPSKEALTFYEGTFYVVEFVNEEEVEAIEIHF